MLPRPDGAAWAICGGVTGAASGCGWRFCGAQEQGKGEGYPPCEPVTTVVSFGAGWSPVTPCRNLP